MSTSIKLDNKKKIPNFLESDFEEYLIDKNQITEYPKRNWFKGSRYR